MQRPFSSAHRVQVVLPSHATAAGPTAGELDAFRQLVARERGELEVELGARVELVDHPDTGEPRFLIGPAHSNPAMADQPQVGEATLWFDPDSQLLVADAKDLAGVSECLHLLRTFVQQSPQRMTPHDCQTVQEAANRVEEEVRLTYPAFELRSLDWQELTARYRPRVAASLDPVAELQRWVAELHDSHTWVHSWPRPGALPYVVRVDQRGAHFMDVPTGTPAWEAGVRWGDQLVGVDAADAFSRTGAPRHLRPLLAGRRLLQAPSGRRRTFTVQRSDATTTEFSDTASQQPWGKPLAWWRTSEGLGYLRVRSFQDGMSDRVDVALADLAAAESLIVDLRGNLGGSLVEALAFRDRFLTQPLAMGTVRYSTGEGELSAPFPITAEASDRRRWSRRVRFLTDPLTCSASEDALLGLQGLAHVQVMGLPSGGGSGRPRSIRLLPGTRLSVSTALTYDRTGHCIEGAGIPVDVSVNWYAQPPLDQVPAEAIRAW